MGRVVRAAVASPLLTSCGGAGFGASGGAGTGAAAGAWAWGVRGGAGWLLGAAATASAVAVASGSVSAAKPAASAPIFDYGTLGAFNACGHNKWWEAAGGGVVVGVWSPLSRFKDLTGSWWG